MSEPVAWEAIEVAAADQLTAAPALTIHEMPATDALVLAGVLQAGLQVYQAQAVDPTALAEVQDVVERVVACLRMPFAGMPALLAVFDGEGRP